MKRVTKPKLLIVGYFGAGNLGDEAILTAQITHLKSHFDILILSLNPERTSIKHHVHCARLPSIRKPQEMLKFFKTMAWADALIVGGGGFLANKLQPFSIYYWLYFMVVAKLLRKKVILFAVGCGPFKKNISLLITKLILNKSDVILLRDFISGIFIKQIGVNVVQEVTADVAFLLEGSNSTVSLPEEIENSSPPRILFVTCPRFHNKKFWKESKYEEKYFRYIRSLSLLADFIVEKMNGTPIFLPFYKEDISFYLAILKTMKHKEQAIFLNHVEDIDFVLTLFQKVDVIVGARYHSIIFSVLTHAPILPIIYHPKCYELVKELHLEDVALELGDGIEWRDIDINPEIAIKNLSKICANAEGIRSLILNKKEELKKRAMKNINFLQNIFYSCDAR